MPSDAARARVRLASIGESSIDVGRAVTLVSGPSIGGIALFIGIVRNHDHGADVTSLDYTQHPTASDVLERCAAETAELHNVEAIAVEHRIGHLEVGDVAVVVAVGAVHREAALAGCAHLINTLKAEVPIWKEQHFASGEAEWVGLSEDVDIRAERVEAQESALRQAQGAGDRLMAQDDKLRAQSDNLRAQFGKLRTQSGRP